MKQKTESELLLEQYLSSLGHKPGVDFEYEPDLRGPSVIDYIFHKHNPPVLFEIKEFSGESKQDAILMSSANSGSAVMLNPYVAVRQKIQEAKKQFKPYKQKYACVLVMYKGQSLTADLDSTMMAGAAYGDLAISFNQQTGQSCWLFQNNGLILPNRNTTFSAICSIDRYFPDKAPASRAFWKKYKAIPESLDKDFYKTYLDFCKEQGFDHNKSCLRVTAIINPFAKHPIDESVFKGQYDSIYITDLSNGRFYLKPR